MNCVVVFVSLYLLSVAYGEEYVKIPTPMSLKALKKDIAGKWYKQVGIVAFNKDFLGCEGHLAMVKDVSKRRVLVDLAYQTDNTCNRRDVDVKLTNKKEVAFNRDGIYHFMFSNDPSIYYLNYACFEEPSAEGCPKSQTDVMVYATGPLDEDTESTIWAQLEELGIDSASASSCTTDPASTEAVASACGI